MAGQRSRTWRETIRRWRQHEPRTAAGGDGATQDTSAEPGRAAPAAGGSASSAAWSAQYAAEPVHELTAEGVAEQVERSATETARLVSDQASGEADDPAVLRPGAPLNRHSPFYLGFMAVLGGLLAYGLVHVVLALSELLTLVVIALFLSLGLEPIVARLVRLGLRRGWAVFVVFCGLAIAFTLLGWLIVPTVAEQSTDVVKQAPMYLNHLQQNHLVKELNARWHLSDRISRDLQKHVLTQETFTSVFGGVLGATRAVLAGVVATVTVLVLTSYLLVAMPSVKTAAYQLVPRSRRPRVVYLSEEIARRVGGYLLGQLCIASLNGVLSYIILRALGLPFPALLAILVGLLALVPVFGTPIGGVLVTLVALSSSVTEAVIVLGYYVAYHLLEAYLVGPRIMRRTVEVPPALTIVAILAGETLLGIVGALIAIPVAAGLMLLYEQVLVPRQQRT